MRIDFGRLFLVRNGAEYFENGLLSTPNYSIGQIFILMCFLICMPLQSHLQPSEVLFNRQYANRNCHHPCLDFNILLDSDCLDSDALPTDAHQIGASQGTSHPIK
jgi:hypothetical protein